MNEVPKIPVFDINSGRRLGSVEFKPENINPTSKLDINGKIYTVVENRGLAVYVDEFVVG